MYNRLKNERSPYLLKHATNPVEWYPWCDEAFEKAINEDKPIFLSIGYFSCHWCTVMEKESFEDPEVARLMNETFVSIKVDREERPDIDDLYMHVCQMMTGSGGWPLTIIMTPDRKPFFAGTYIPKETRSGMVGMLDLIPRVQELWKSRRGELVHEGENVISMLKKMARTERGTGLSDEDVEAAYEQLISSFDEEFGGFGIAPKFPSVDKLMFLLRYWRNTGSKASLIIVEKTLKLMRAGGIFDQVGLGFHRYSTDQAWMVPHFEKMLYDQAMLAMIYAEAYQATRSETYGRTAKEVLDYAIENLLSPEGGFYSSEDADSDGEEGKFYLWSEADFRRALGTELVDEGSKMLLEGGGMISASNGVGRVLHLSRPLPEGENGQGYWNRYEEIRRVLLKERAKRVRPARDEKILTDWNGLMIASLSRTASILGESGSKYLDKARRCADLMIEKVFKHETIGEVQKFSGLYHMYKDGQPSIDGLLEDYACLGWGLVELYLAGFDEKYLAASIELAKKAVSDFWDTKEGGFLRASKSELQYKLKDAQDGSIPPGNSVMALLLTLLSRITGNTDFEKKVEEIESTFSVQVKSYPSAYTFLLSSTVLLRKGFHEIVIVGKRSSPRVKEMVQVIRQRYIPNKVLILRDISVSPPGIDNLSSFTSACSMIGEGATAYVCTNFACSLPVTSTEELLNQLG
ncbi:MAG: thioredoxin domain-containing protein [Nitrososphaerota archaeon]|jgi:uncharacterized protein YyaL (SSP411 family)|nr:thioredoxin domain-containing protein [Nitrososphaerota archaeon]